MQVGSDSDNCFLFALSQIGESHKNSGKRCQDFSYCCRIGDYKLISVADGHGNNNYPRAEIGACIAALSSSYWLYELVKYLDKNNIDIKNAESEIERAKREYNQSWIKRVNDDAEKFPFTQSELMQVDKKSQENFMNKVYKSAYGTTMICACITPKYWIALQIGDGTCVALRNDGATFEPIKADKKCRENVTTSMSNEYACDYIRVYHSKDLPMAVFLCTDGVDDSYSKKKLHTFYNYIYRQVKSIGAETAVKNLEKYMPELTALGSGDDVSISGFLDLEKIGRK